MFTKGPLVRRIACLGLATAAVGLGAAEAPAPGGPAPISYAIQGWTQQDRDTFYTTSQGSHLIPVAWFRALRRTDIDAPFAADQLDRYGYLRNDSAANTEALPVGFTVDHGASPAQLGMTCAACHTGEIDYQSGGSVAGLRLDGAPARADFQQFLQDLSAAAQATQSDPVRFEAFARTVLGPVYSPEAVLQLRADFAAWVAQFSDFMTASLPPQAWGPGRLDAFGMIFNRVAGRDPGLPQNIVRADAPVSYPFLWNAHWQDHTQWNGIVPNGLFTTAIARNTGEVIGVFAHYAPKQIFPGYVDYGDNSIDFANLQTLEEKVAVLQPPPWPKQAFGYDPALAKTGERLFQAHCAECHAQQVSTLVPGGKAWVTPVVPGDTDPRMATNAARISQSGPFQFSLKLGEIPPAGFGETAATADILKTSVIGTLIHNAISVPIGQDSGARRALEMDGQAVTTPATLAGANASLQSKLRNLYAKPPQADPRPAYEARVLYGIWATAPYLHNGSVPTLYDLLLPPAQRPKTFMVGTRLFDPTKVGYRTDAGAAGNRVVFDTSLPGNSNAGHVYGVDTLTNAQRLALLEYLKDIGPAQP